MLFSRKSAPIAALILALCLAAALPSKASAQSSFQVPSPLYPTIQSAIDAAPDDSSIAIAPGIYEESLRIVNKRLQLAGGPLAAGPTRIIGRAFGAPPDLPILTIEGSAAVVDLTDLEIEHIEPRPIARDPLGFDPIGIQLTDGQLSWFGGRVSRCAIFAENAIMTLNALDLELVHLTANRGEVTARSLRTLGIHPMAGSQLSLWLELQQPARAIFEDCEFRQHSLLTVSGGTEVRVQRCLFDVSHVSIAGLAEFQSCRFERSDMYATAVVLNQATASLTDCQFLQCEGPSLSLFQGTAQIVRCQFLDCGSIDPATTIFAIGDLSVHLSKIVNGYGDGIVHQGGTLEVSHSLLGNDASPYYLFGIYPFVAIRSSGQTTIDHTTIVRYGTGLRLDPSSLGGAITMDGGQLNLRNSIAWWCGQDPLTLTGGATADVQHSTIEGGFPGTGNDVQFPGFRGFADWTLSPSSTSIDRAGPPLLPLPPRDLAGNLRQNFWTADRGAYEYMPQTDVWLRAERIEDSQQHTARLELEALMVPAPNSLLFNLISPDPRNFAFTTMELGPLSGLWIDPAHMAEQLLLGTEPFVVTPPANGRWSWATNVPFLSLGASYTVISHLVDLQQGLILARSLPVMFGI